MNPALTAQEMLQKSQQAPQWLIEDLLPVAGVVTFAGEPGIGKSFTALSWATAVANDSYWFDWNTASMEPFQERRNVVYVLGEGFAQFGKRVESLDRLREPAGNSLHFVDGAGQGINLSNPASTQKLIGLLEPLNPELVILDTFSALAGVKSENDNAEVAKVYAVAQRISSMFSCTVVFIHHMTKDAQHVRGATAIRGNSDTVIVAKKASQSGLTLSTYAKDDGKQRDGEPVLIEGLFVSSDGILDFDPPMGRVYDDDLRVTSRG
ncbi:AAA family ATPase [Glutamicibacter ardleyensis]|uniref:AAA family ATPase n=1 Tax=Glutamicibacter ardleyensis TaxID=225894 RepID=UPI003FD5933A